MDHGRKFEVLKGLKVLLKFTELYPSDLLFLGIPISIPLIFRPILFSLFLFFFTSISLCASLEWDLNVISGPLCFLCGSIQIVTIYFNMRSSKSIVIESIDLLQVLVEQSKFFYEKLRLQKSFLFE